MMCYILKHSPYGSVVGVSRRKKKNRLGSADLSVLWSLQLWVLSCISSASEQVWVLSCRCYASEQVWVLLPTVVMPGGWNLPGRDLSSWVVTLEEVVVKEETLDSLDREVNGKMKTLEEQISLLPRCSTPLLEACAGC